MGSASCSGGALEVIPGPRTWAPRCGFRAIRDAVQFELDSFHFSKLARAKAATPEQPAPCWKVFYDAALTTLPRLEAKSMPTWIEKVVGCFPPTKQTLLSTGLFRGSFTPDSSGIIEHTRQRSKMDAHARPFQEAGA